MTFEDKFMAIQASMVSVSLEYVENQADKVYIYCILEKEIISFKNFFKIGTRFLHLHQESEVLGSRFAYSDEVRFSLLTFGNQDIEALMALCKAYGREHPTEMWLIYDATKNSLDAKYSYEARYEKDNELLLSTNKEFEKWFEEVKANHL